MTRKTKLAGSPTAPELQSVKEIVEYGYTEASKYFAEYRLIPSIYDGMKPVYRRVMMSAYEICKDKFVKTATLSGHTLGKYHPHSIDAISGVVHELVNAGILQGEGEFGSKYLDGTVVEGAASRYTAVRLHPAYRDLFDKIIKYVPTRDGELESKELCYIPMPLPFMLYRGGFGLGPGLSTKTPAFTMASMLEALDSDDPKKLKSTYEYRLINKDNCLEKIWKTGNGNMYLQLDIGKDTVAGKQGAFITGSAQVFTPNLKVINDWREKGWVSVDEIGKGVSKLFVGKNKGVGQVTPQDIYEELVRISVSKEAVLLKVIAPDGVVHPIGLKTWISSCYNNFLSLIDKYKQDKINDVQFRIQMMKDFDVIKEYIINHMRDPSCTPESIAKATGKKLDIVKEIDSWSVNRLRKTVAADELKKLNKELKDAQAFNVKQYARNFVNKVDFTDEQINSIKGNVAE